jgi:ribosomal protein S18 acetylase RimI-like enzyme
MVTRLDDNFDVTIRAATDADVATIGRLGALLVRTHHAFDAKRFMSPGRDAERGYASFIRTQLGEKDVTVLVAERAGDVIGYVYAGLEPRDWMALRDSAGVVHDVVVDPSHRRGGVGRTLLAAAMEWLRAHGAPRVVLWTAERNEPAQRLFAKSGFRRTMIEMTRELD